MLDSTRCPRCAARDNAPANPAWLQAAQTTEDRRARALAQFSDPTARARWIEGLRRRDTDPAILALRPRGPSHYLWHPDTDRDARKTPEYRAWRKAVFERDDYTCHACGARGGRLHAHHIEHWATTPERRLDVDNGVTLCADPCHREAHRMARG